LSSTSNRVQENTRGIARSVVPRMVARRKANEANRRPGCETPAPVIPEAAITQASSLPVTLIFSSL
jgi:hypothetical protein